MPIDEMGTAFVEAVKVPTVPGVQKPPRWVGKRFRDHLVAAPRKEKVKKPVGQKTRPAWLQQDRLGVSLAVCCGNAGCQVVSAAVQALRWLTVTISSRDLTRMVKERWLRCRTV